MNMIVLLVITLCVLTFVGQGHAVVLTINPVGANATVLTGNELVQLNCTSDTPADIRWNFNGSQLPPNHATVTADPSNTLSTLTVINPTPDKSGDYSCFVPFTLGTTVSTTLNIFAPIYLLNSNPKISALIGDTVTMRVSSLGLGQHVHQWSRRGRNVNIKEDATGIDTVQLTLPNVSIADAGRYLFTTTSQWSMNRTRVDLTLTYPPAVITEQPQNHSTFVSLSATFRCNASSLYPVAYSWRRVNSALSITDRVTGLNTNTLVISSVGHSDEGLYQCVATVFDVESFSEPAYLVVEELPPLQNLKVKMSLEQNEVMLNWTRPDTEIISSNLKLSYKLFYTLRGVCAVSRCQGVMCSVQRMIKNIQASVTFNQNLFPYTNYSWLLELTYSNNGLTVEHYNTSVDAQTSQSGASAPINLTVLDQSFHSVNLMWGTPQCPNGIISGYRVFYNDSFIDVNSGTGQYVLSGLTANTVYNISVAAITGDNSDTIGDYISIITMTSLGGAVEDSRKTAAGSSSSSSNVMIIAGAVIAVIIICLLLGIITAVIIFVKRKKRKHLDIPNHAKKNITNSLYNDDITNPLYSGDTFIEVTNKQYAVVNPRYQEHAICSSHIYETISEKQEKGQKTRPPSEHGYCYIDSVNIKLLSDKKSGTVKSNIVPLSDKSEDFCTSDEENTVYNINYSRAMPPASKQPTDTHAAETRSEISTGKHPPPAKQYASLDPVGRNTVGQYQKPITGEQLCPRKQDASPDVSSHEAEVVNDYERLKHSTT